MGVDVERLAREHKTAVQTDEGIEFHSVPSLLSQLREAIFGGMESTGGGASKESKLPISAAALDLYTSIDRQITEAWVAAFKRPPNTDRPERLISEWAAWASSDTIVEIGGSVAYADDWIARWEQRIADFFDPPRLAEIKAPCPKCEVEHVTTVIDGEEIQSPALRFHRSRSTGQTLDARCLACGAVWMPAEFERLASVIGVDVEAKRREHAANDQTGAR